MILNHNILKSIILKSHCIKDLYRIRTLINIDENDIGKWMISKIHQRLYKMGIDAKEFVEKMIEGKAIISGSFPLQCILGEEWENSDIDVFLIGERTDETFWDKLLLNGSPEDCDDFRRMLNEEGMVDTYRTRNTNLYINYNIKNSFDKYIAQKGYFVRKGKGYWDTDFHIWEYKYKNNKLQIIYCDPNNDLMEHIDAFDFSFCKIVYDGVRVYFDDWDNIYHKFGYINDNIFNSEARIVNAKKRTMFLTQYHFKSLELLMESGFMKRYKKYKERGFTFQNEEDFDYMLKEE